MKIFLLIVKVVHVLILLFIVGYNPVSSQISINLEGGVGFTGYNDARIPGDGGTMIRFSRQLDSKPFIYERVHISYSFTERHAVLLLYAPLRVTYNGSLSGEVNFNNMLFGEGNAVDATFKFNSYRLTYRYGIFRGDRFDIDLGVTAKIRDAYIQLSEINRSSKRTDLGFVPLINFVFDWQFSRYFRLILEGDALAAPQGRAEDILLAFGYSPNKNLDIITGYRLLEGGADNEEVYTFSLFHYAAIGVRIHI